MDDRAKVRLLEEEVQQLRDRIDVLEQDFLGTDIPIPIEWRLTQSEGRLIRALARRPELTKAQLVTALYYDRVAEEEVPEPKIVDVMICKARRKLKPFGVSITTLWGTGFALDAETRRMLTETSGGSP